MRSHPDKSRYLDSVVLVVLFAAFVFLPPFVSVWATPTFPWYMPYFIWGGVILLIALVQSMRDRHDV